MTVRVLPSSTLALLTGAGGPLRDKRESLLPASRLSTRSLRRPAAWRAAFP